LQDDLLLKSMTACARQIVERREELWDVVGEASGDANALDVSTKYAFEAYVMWAEISDFYDDPATEEVGDRVARAVAAAWLSVDVAVGSDVDRFFSDWEPYFGKRFRAEAGWRQRTWWSRVLRELRGVAYAIERVLFRRSAS
jgi:hypothetical protein